MADHSALAKGNDLGMVAISSFATANFRLQSGETLPELRLVYETYGSLARGGGNAILITHGYTSSQHAAGRSADGEPGWWNGLIGPGKTIDTDRYFVVCSNMLGSSYGSTGPASINPKTGKPYGPDFPAYTVFDMVRAQHAMLDALGVKHLAAVAGPSYGGYQAFAWAVTYPRDMDGVAAVVTSPKVINGEQTVDDLRAQFDKVPGFNGGRYYGTGAMRDYMTELRIATLKRYGVEADLAARFLDAEAREAEIRRQAENWARVFDANSMIALARARAHFDAQKDFAKIRAKLLYVLSRTDKLFPPSIAPRVMQHLKAAGVDATYYEIDSEIGHLASDIDWAKWAPVLQGFLGRLP
ncbi:MAG: homoserine O-acetyltransferase family protein [Candidatus Binataceae bacterium]